MGKTIKPGGGAASSNATNRYANDDGADTAVQVRPIPQVYGHAARYIKVMLVGDNGVEFTSRLLEINAQVVKLKLWDAARDEQFRSIDESYYQGSQIAMLYCDITRRETFENLSQWLANVRARTSPDTVICLIACKSDLAVQRKVTAAELQEFADTEGLFYRECSAKTADGVDDIFVGATERVSDVQSSMEKAPVTRGTSRGPSNTRTTGGASAGHKRAISTEPNFADFKWLYLENRSEKRIKSPSFWGMAGRLNHPKFFNRLGMGINNLNDVNNYVVNNVKIKNGQGDMNSLRSARILADNWGKRVKRTNSAGAGAADTSSTESIPGLAS